MWRSGRDGRQQEDSGTGGAAGVRAGSRGCPPTSAAAAGEELSLKDTAAALWRSRFSQSTFLTKTLPGYITYIKFQLQVHRALSSGFFSNVFIKVV